MKSTIISKVARVNNRVTCCLSVGVLYCAFFALSGGFTLYFVYSLRKRECLSSKTPICKGDRADNFKIFSDLQSMKSDSTDKAGDDSMELSMHSTGSGFAPPFHYALNNQARPTLGSGRVFIEAQSHDSDRKSLEKLVADLTLSVPLVLIMAVYYPVGGIFVCNYSIDEA
jgi:hypothetical protein